ncbi:MAG: ABC transporter ATP-binding protein [Azovibrio sp.]|uniref:ABC transporter ATP-binding protein n=2 Tax=Azovibrio sp. TaxID=1872673 RepID=UPI003C706FBA
MSALLLARALAVGIGAHEVCTHLDLELAAGETLVILGRNGAGKSTLLATLAGLRPPRAGALRLAGQGYAEHGPKAAARLRAWLGQQRGDPFATTVLETALTGRHPHLGRWQWEGPEDLRIARQALADVGLAGLEERAVQTLSGGERQRLAIATLLTQEAPLMLLDEPLTHLDLNHQIAVLELLARRAASGAGIISVLHDPGLAWRYADRVLLIYGDGDTELGPADALLTPERLFRLYGHPLVRVAQNGRVAFIPE